MADVEQLAAPDPLGDTPWAQQPIGSWVTRADCGALGSPDSFTGQAPDDEELAVLERICRRCPVKAPCTAYADAVAAVGLWGGTWRPATRSAPEEAAA